jgi:hypothetical protein
VVRVPVVVEVRRRGVVVDDGRVAVRVDVEYVRRGAEVVARRVRVDLEAVAAARCGAACARGHAQST